MRRKSRCLARITDTSFLYQITNIFSTRHDISDMFVVSVPWVPEGFFWWRSERATATHDPLSQSLHVLYNFDYLQCRKCSVTWYLPMFEQQEANGGLFRTYFNTDNHQAPVVQRLANAIYWINHYPVDREVYFANYYLLDSDLSREISNSRVHPLTNWGQMIDAGSACVQRK